MPSIDFPIGVTGLTYTFNGTTWQYNGYAWVVIGSSSGPVGPQGFQGISGTIGVDGAQGPQGAQGIAGTIGVDGAQGPQGFQGSQGSQGSAISYIRRHSFTNFDGSNSYDYNGYAPVGSSESSNVWTITRILISSNGSTIVEKALNVAWTDRISVPYV